MSLPDITNREEGSHGQEEGQMTGPTGAAHGGASPAGPAGDALVSDELFAAASGLLIPADLLNWLGALQRALCQHFERFQLDRDGLDDEGVLRELGATISSLGVEVIGAGSTRIAVPIDHAKTGTRLVAKIAWNREGLSDNLNEAATWLAIDQQRARLLIPLLCITRDGVLIAARAEPIAPAWGASPTNPYATRGSSGASLGVLGNWATHAAEGRHGGDIRSLRRALGRTEDWETAELRPNNYGRWDGRLVLVDIASIWPLEPVPDEIDLERSVSWLTAQGDDLMLDRRALRKQLPRTRSS
jgi:hypothetical protein